MGRKKGKVQLKDEFVSSEDKLEFEDNLIRMVEQHPHVWDLKDPGYKLRKKRENTFIEVGEKLSKSGMKTIVNKN